MDGGVGAASALAALVAVAFQSSTTLHDLVKSFRSHNQRVRDLLEELGALSGVLSSLGQTVQNVQSVDLSALEFPVQRCGRACSDFEQEILKCTSDSPESRTSFRGWARLKYMGEDIDGFRRLLASYKLTISVALTDATLRTSSANVENAENYNALIIETRGSLEDRLDSMDAKLELLLTSDASVSHLDVDEVEQLREERRSTEKCLQICAELSSYIAHIQAETEHRRPKDQSSEHPPRSETIMDSGLEQCRDDLARTVKKLAVYEAELFNRMLEKSKTALESEEGRTDLARLRDEWEATRQSRDICAQAQDHLRDKASTIDNYAVGDAVQFMVSTNDKTIHGKNRGLGWRTRQFGGHIDPQALQEIARNFGNASNFADIHEDSKKTQSKTSPNNEQQTEMNTKFTDQYGSGFKLTPR